MLRRSRTHRVISLLAGAWLALFSMVPNVWRPCPMHAAGHETAATAMGHAGMHETERAAAESLAYANAIAPREHAVPAPTPGRPTAPRPCDCTTNCCGLPAFLRIDHPVQLQTPPLRIAERLATPPAPPHAPWRARVLPFANGPPVVIAG